MPKPILKKNDIIKILNDNVKLLSEIAKSIEIKIVKNVDEILLECDKEQIARVFFNLIKNSIESIDQKAKKNTNFKKKISIEILYNNDHIKIILLDNGIGFSEQNNIKEILNPYYTTKRNGTGLGLSIVNKIINDHKGDIEFIPINDGARIEIKFKLDDSRNTHS
jgi:two-component system nitrogen regulation sensor histidine kinase NtrY